MSFVPKKPPPKPGRVVPTEPPVFTELERRGIVIVACRKPSGKAWSAQRGKKR